MWIFCFTPGEAFLDYSFKFLSFSLNSFFILINKKVDLGQTKLGKNIQKFKTFCFYILKWNTSVFQFEIFKKYFFYFTRNMTKLNINIRHLSLFHTHLYISVYAHTFAYADVNEKEKKSYMNCLSLNCISLSQAYFKPGNLQRLNSIFIRLNSKFQNWGRTQNTQFHRSHS